jgi:hypothetical protein
MGRGVVPRRGTAPVAVSTREDTWHLTSGTLKPGGSRRSLPSSQVRPRPKLSPKRSETAWLACVASEPSDDSQMNLTRSPCTVPGCPCWIRGQPTKSSDVTSTDCRAKGAEVTEFMHYIDLSRRFRDLTQTELESPELLASLNDRPWMTADGWPELLQCPRVLLLAEAGSGKTAEMREQAARLRVEGKPAFFVPLESLDRDPLTDLLSPEEEQAFAAWKGEDQSTAWFFLDAVDELKLTRGKLERALNRLVREINGLLHRAHVVISCRPYDWHPSLDMAIVQTKLPVTPSQPLELPNPDEAFLAPLRNQGGRQEQAPTVAPSRVVVLLPLSEQQIATLAGGLGVEDTAAFLEEIRRRDAMNFARRPLDLTDLVTLWKTNGRLGTRAEQHSANVATKLKDDPARPDRGLLSDERARNGAERLALALTLTHTRTIRSPEQSLDAQRADGVLDPAKVLPDWSEEERQTLLRRALFDPATYGRVRFHHRSVQEYLAACRLQALRDKGMPTKFLHRLLFADLYGMPLVLPSMQAVAAWLALWDDDVRRELMAREPETLLSMGDPESLPIGTRTQLLRAFAEAYGKGGWRGFNIPIEEVRRLAHPELAHVIRELLEAKPTNPDVVELLLEMIWQGSIEGCTDIARAAVFDVDQLEQHRMIAIRALVACDKVETLREISTSILAEPTKWPDLVIHTIVDYLFPTMLSTTELLRLIQRTREPKNKGGGFYWATRQIAERIEPSSDTAAELRDALTDLVWQSRCENQNWHELKGRFDYIAPALARLCDRQLEASATAFASDNCLIWSCIVANRFGRDRIDVDDLAKNLKRHFDTMPALREAAFWGDLKLMSEVARTEDLEERLSRVEHTNLINQLTPEDRPWLLEALRSSRDSEQRLIALHALLRLWRRHGRTQNELDEMSVEVQDDAHLHAVLLQKSVPPEPDREYEKWQRKARRLRLVQEGRERQRLEGWEQWRKELLSAPEVSFSEEKLPTTIRNLYNWLRMRSRQSSHRYNAWDADAVREAFGNDVVAGAAKAFQAVWRAHPPTLWSERPHEKRDYVLWVWMEGLTGLAAESATPGWATCLTTEEARIAAVYATIEINGFPTWLQDVVTAHPTAVDDVIGGELAAQLALEQEHLRILQNLILADSSIKRLLAPRLLTKLLDWPLASQNEEAGRHSAHHLEQVFAILDDVVENKNRATIAAICDSRFSEQPDGLLAPVWLRSLFRVDVERATEIFEANLASLQEQDRAARAIAVFASLFGSRDTLPTFEDDVRRAVILGRLVRCAYRYVRPREDQEHEGAYSPDTRNLAETARGFLLTTLLDTAGAEAQRVVSELAEDPAFAHFPDRLRLLARQRAAKDAESLPLRPGDVVALEKRYEVPPHDRDSLFAVMNDRLDQLAHDLAHDDFSDRRLLQKIDKEIEMQRTLARRLRDAAKGAYVVSREEEVADEKEPDIRLATMQGEQKVAIEVKLAHRWSVTKLEDALRTQLVGQYLRHNICKAGCLLLTHHKAASYWKHPQTKVRLSFGEVIEHLRCIAKDIEQEQRHEVRVVVFPLDLTDPPLGHSAVT